MPKLRLVLISLGLAFAMLSCRAQSIIVTQLFHSGLPDNKITVTNSSSPSISTLKTYLQSLPSASQPTWPILGLRGYLLDNESVAGFPEEVRVFQGVIRIYQSGVFSYHLDVHGLESYLNSVFGSVDPPPISDVVAKPAVDPPLPRSGSEPPYNPAIWNDHDGVELNNNCYNYATNKRTNTFAQPGKASIGAVTDMACTPVLQSAIEDGLIPWVENVQCPSDKRKVALVVAPGTDYHWYRQDSNGNWSHKPGGTDATNLDGAGNPITNPRLANRAGGGINYVNFCAYMCVRSDPGQVDISFVTNDHRELGLTQLPLELLPLSPSPLTLNPSEADFGKLSQPSLP